MYFSKNVAGVVLGYFQWGLSFPMRRLAQSYHRTISAKTNSKKELLTF